MLLYFLRESFILRKNKKNNRKDCNWEPVMGRWRKEGAVNSSPLPLPVLCQPLVSLLQSLTSHKRRPMRALGHPHFSSQAPPIPSSLIYPPPSLHPVQCTMCCQRASRQCTEKQPEREGEKGKVWVDFSADLEAFSRHATVTSLVSFRPPLLSLSLLSLPFSVYFLFLQARINWKRDSRGQRCSVVWGSTSPHH